jgi:hypothetical protein
MNVAFSRAIVSLAGRCLGDDRRDWAAAMEAELDAARLDGKDLIFAAGCLIGAFGQMASYRDGRLALARHAVCVFLTIPFAVLIAIDAAARISYPTSNFGFETFASARGSWTLAFNQANINALPAFTFLIMFIVFGHALLAWMILDRKWAHVSLISRLIAAATVTLIVVSGVLFLDETWILILAAGVSIEIAATFALMRWDTQRFSLS